MQCRVLVGVIALWAVLGVPAQTHDELMRRGNQAMDDERYPEAARAYRDARQVVNPSHPDFQSIQVTLLAYEAEAWELANQPLRAIVLVEWAIALDETYPGLRKYWKDLELQAGGATISKREIANALKVARRVTLVNGEPSAVHLPVNFHFNSVDLTENGKRQAGEMLEYMRDLTPPEQRFMLVGHTDTQGEEDYNLRLSRERAEELRKWFVARSDLLAGRIETSGLGESKPRLDGDSEAEHARNRRVELQLLP